MIESNILGAAAGVQYQGVIDKSEGTSLPALSNGVIIGRFKRGYTGKVFTVTADSYRMMLGHDPSNPSYMAVADLFSRGVSEVSVCRVGATVQPPPPINYEGADDKVTTVISKDVKHEAIGNALDDLFGKRDSSGYRIYEGKLGYYYSPKYTVYGENSTTGRETLQAAAEFGCRNYGGIKDAPTMDYSLNRGGVQCVGGGRRIDYKPDTSTYLRTTAIKTITDHIIKKAQDGDKVSQDFVRQATTT